MFFASGLVSSLVKTFAGSRWLQRFWDFSSWNVISLFFHWPVLIMLETWHIITYFLICKVHHVFHHVQLFFILSFWVMYHILSSWSVWTWSYNAIRLSQWLFSCIALQVVLNQLFNSHHILLIIISLFLIISGWLKYIYLITGRSLVLKWIWILMRHVLVSWNLLHLLIKNEIIIINLIWW